MKILRTAAVALAGFFLFIAALVFGTHIVVSTLSGMGVL